MAKHHAICRVSRELANEFRNNLPPDTRILAESIVHSNTETYFILENSAFSDSENDHTLPFVKAEFSRSSTGEVKFVRWCYV